MVQGGKFKRKTGLFSSFWIKKTLNYEKPNFVVLCFSWSKRPSPSEQDKEEERRSSSEKKKEKKSKRSRSRSRERAHHHKSSSSRKHKKRKDKDKEEQQEPLDEESKVSGRFLSLLHKIFGFSSSRLLRLRVLNCLHKPSCTC